MNELTQNHKDAVHACRLWRDAIEEISSWPQLRDAYDLAKRVADYDDKIDRLAAGDVALPIDDSQQTGGEK